MQLYIFFLTAFVAYETRDLFTNQFHLFMFPIKRSFYFKISSPNQILPCIMQIDIKIFSLFILCVGAYYRFWLL